MKNEVFLTDCMEYMAGVPNGFFDLCICDPPYGIKTSMQDNRKRGKIGSHYKIKKWDNKIPDKTYFIELFRISKFQIIWGGNYFIENLKNTSCFIIWDKKTVGNTADCEIAWTSFRTAIKKFTYLWEGFWQENMKNKEKRIHPTQKPVALYKWILQNYAKPGWTIFDSHVGSGSIRVACHDLGFDFTGCELDPDYHRDQEERFQNHIANPELFDKQEIQENIFQQGVLV
jgi:site-specific DNA-methyltransferase (adenine-specific)